MARFPAELVASIFGGSYKHRRISRSSRRHVRQDITSRDSLGGVNHLLNRIAGAIAEVEDMLASCG